MARAPIQPRRTGGGRGLRRGLPLRHLDDGRAAPPRSAPRSTGVGGHVLVSCEHALGHADQRPPAPGARPGRGGAPRRVAEPERVVHVEGEARRAAAKRPGVPRPEQAARDDHAVGRLGPVKGVSAAREVLRPGHHLEDDAGGGERRGEGAPPMPHDRPVGVGGEHHQQSRRGHARRVRDPPTPPQMVNRCQTPIHHFACLAVDGPGGRRGGEGRHSQRGSTPRRWRTKKSLRRRRP